MLISSSIPNLINGVSQQPDTLRLASQAEEQINFLSSVADGLTTRPPSRHLAKLDAAVWNGAFLHTINRDVQERYIVCIRNNVLRVFEAQTGTERVVNAPEGWGYLNAASNQSYRATTVADFTFILNAETVVQADPTLTPARTNQAMVFVKAGNYGKTYRIFVDGTEVATFETPDGSTASHANQIDTGYIVEQLLLDLNTNLPAGFTTSRRGDIIIIGRSDSTAFSIRATDGLGGTNIDAIQSQVQRFSDLPKDAPIDFEVEVVGDHSSSFDNYFVKYTSDGGAGSVGVWKEHYKGGEEFRLDGSTLPHVLVREADGTFTFRQASWEERQVGDLKKVPHPSFVGRVIRDVFFFQNRLGFIADENVVMSQDGEYYDFFRSTATTILDTDPIDIAVTSDRVSLLNFAVPFNKTLLLFSDQSQFVLEGAGTLTAQTASVAQSTSFESLVSVRPVGVGQFVYFPVPKGSFSGLREYFVQEGNEQNDALDVTSHVPRYLPRGLFQMSASSAEDTLLALSTESPNSIWVYRYFFNQEGKLQSAWSEWRFNAEDTILSVSFIESTLYLIVGRSDGTYLESLNLSSGIYDDDGSVRVRADRGVTQDQCVINYDAPTNTTTLTLPYETTAPLHVVTGMESPDGIILPYEQADASTIVLRGDYSQSSLLVGQKYLSRYVFSKFFIKEQQAGGGQSSNANGRLQLRYLSVDYSNTGYFRLISQPEGRRETSRVFSGRTLGVASGTLGSLHTASGRFRFPVMCRNTAAYLAIETDSPFPASFTAAEWEATYTTRSRKV